MPVRKNCGSTAAIFGMSLNSGGAKSCAEVGGVGGKTVLAADIGAVGIACEC